MKFGFLIALCISQLAFAHPSLEKYVSYLDKLGKEKGTHKKGEIEVVLDPAQISQIENIQKERLIKKGFSNDEAEELSRVGIVYEDQYWIWVRDAVYFPKGIPGTYNRLIWKSELGSSFNGAVVLPILPSGKIVLNLNYRHATRSWELELPRGGKLANESEEDTARRELKEETGLEVSSIAYLGRVASDTGVLSSVVPVFFGKVSASGKSDKEYSEAIADVMAFTKEEIQQGLIKGTMDVSINGKIESVPIRDAFLTFALLQAELRKLL